MVSVIKNRSFIPEIQECRMQMTDALAKHMIRL
jgi:hypothetical protein